MKQFVQTLIGRKNYYQLHELFLPYGEKKKLNDGVVFYRNFIKKNDIVFDVGANFGNRINIFRKINSRVIAFEPQPDCCKYLERRFGSEITIVDKGVGEKKGIDTLYISDAKVLSSFSEEWIEAMKTSRFNECSWDEKIDVEIITLDEAIELYGKPEFVKIDVEGYEYQVLLGLSHSIPFLSFEYNTPEKADIVFKCLDRLDDIYSQNYYCNFSVGESLKLEMSHWLDSAEFRNFVETSDFQQSRFGDIYIKSDQIHAINKEYGKSG